MYYLQNIPYVFDKNVYVAVLHRNFLHISVRSSWPKVQFKSKF